MGQEWRITIWGVRGSAPRPAAGYLEYGGNTVCTALEWNDELVVLDAGSGLSCLGQKLVDGNLAAGQPVGSLSVDQRFVDRQLVSRQTVDGFGYRRLHILLSHPHLDHVLGLFQFSPFYHPETEVHLYGGPGFRQKLKTLIGPPWWPVGFREFRAKLFFHELCPGDDFVLEGLRGLKGHTMEGNHPGGSLLYRLDESWDGDKGVIGSKNGDSGKGRDGDKGRDRNTIRDSGEDPFGKSLVYGLDCEINEALFPVFAKFVQESSLLIWDAGFTEKDLRPGWGHSTWEQGIAMRKAAGAKRVLMTHYNWGYSDMFLKRQEGLARQEDSACIFGKEGMVIVL